MRKFTKEQLDACICIARYQPRGVNLLNYMDVAPKDQILWKYKRDKDQEAYTKAYKNQLLRLDVQMKILPYTKMEYKKVLTKLFIYGNI